jgi:ankyrin repeat protein
MKDQTYSFLMCAASRPKYTVETLQFLLENGADPNKHRLNGGDAFANDCVVGPLAKAKMLIDYGTNVNSKLGQVIGNDNSVLHVAVFNYHKDIGSMLVDYGANVNAVNEQNITVLSRACNEGTMIFVKKLLENGADCNLAGSDGMNPIMNTARIDKIHLLELLLRQESININYLACENLSPLMMSCMYGQHSFF